MSAPAVQSAVEQHPVLIPGSNRDYSCVLRPLPDAHKSGYSVNHGTGRRMSRGEANKLLDQRQVDEQYRHAGILVNFDGQVLLDESAQCYKKSEDVIRAVVDAGLPRVEDTLWPLASLKATEEGASSKARRARKAEKTSRERDRDAHRRNKGHY